MKFIGDLNAIAPLISNFYLASYTLVNFCTFHASLTKPIGWRPTFKYYNTWLSLLATFICVAIMFLISWVTALITYTAIISCYMLVMYRKPGAISFDFYFFKDFQFSIRCELGLDDSGADLLGGDEPAAEIGLAAGARQELQAPDSGAERPTVRQTGAH
jgi:Amino acid permease